MGVESAAKGEWNARAPTGLGVVTEWDNERACLESVRRADMSVVWWLEGREGRGVILGRGDIGERNVQMRGIHTSRHIPTPALNIAIF